MRLLISTFLLAFTLRIQAQHSIPFIPDSSKYKPDDKGVFEFVEQLPEFQGGERELINFLKINTHVPVLKIDKPITQKILVRFIVNEQGVVDDVYVSEASPYPALDAEAIRVVKMLPGFIPGKIKGKPVKVYFALPFVFKLP